MGEVYRARDERLNRDVAIKVLPAAFSADAERLRRFEQEAQAAGTLSHPNILSIYDVETHDGAPYVVSELLEGESLRDRLQHGPLPHRKAVDYALQIARGLTAAHEKGIVHRDLKPENLFLTHDGRIKILDFGLAKLVESEAQIEDQTNVPTKKLNTSPGMILGTVGYMSPEQAQGNPVDYRSDIFSLGAVLYEMLTGQRAFARGSAVETLNAIIKEDAPEFPAGINISPPLESVVHHCLEKKRERRFQSASDVAFALQTFYGPSGSTSAQPASSSVERVGRKWFVWGASAVALLFLLLTLTVVVTYLRWVPRENVTTVRFTIAPPANTEFLKNPDYPYSVAVSPDGKRMAVVTRAEGQTQLWLRSLDSLSMQQLLGTEGASNPFWSPDSRFIAFFSEDGKLKRIDPAGGPPQIICDAPAGVCAGTWSKDGVILFYRQQEGIYRVDAGGGEPVQVTRPDPSRQEMLHIWPYFLPDGRHFLYCAANKKRDAYKINVAALDSGEVTTLLQANSRVAYAPPGYLLYVRDATLLAQAFDLKTLRLSGEPIPVAEGLSYFNPTGDADFSVSENGVLAFKAGAIISRLIWFDRKGAEHGFVGEAGRYGRLRLSPDGQRVAVDLIEPHTGTSDIWIYELPSSTSSRVTVDIEQELGAIWSPDKHQLVFSKDREGPPHLFLKDLNNSNEAEELVPVTGGVQGPNDWSVNGQFLIYEDQNPGTGSDLWLLPMTGGRRPSPFLRTRFNEWGARLSQDSRWVAYVSDESGRPEVYVCNFGNSAERRQISTSGGDAPRWRSDGKELFYVAADSRLMAASIRSGATFEAGSPVALFKIGAERSSYYDVTADGQRFLVNTRTDAQPLPITVVLNWTAQLK